MEGPAVGRSVASARTGCHKRLSRGGGSKKCLDYLFFALHLGKSVFRKRKIRSPETRHFARMLGGGGCAEEGPPQTPTREGGGGGDGGRPFFLK